MKATIFGYYVTMGMMDALRLVLKCDEIAPLIKVNTKINSELICHCCICTLPNFSSDRNKDVRMYFTVSRSHSI